MTIGIILLARMGSSRLPGKVLSEVCGKPILEHIINRLKRVRNVDKLVLATTVNKKDDILEEFCASQKVDCFRGSEDNVLERCIQASETFGLDVIVRMGADTPFADWQVVSDMLDVFLKEYDKNSPLEYLSNSLKRSYPLGLDADIMTLKCLKRIDEETKSFPKDERILNEINVVPYVQQNPDKFRTYSYHKDFDYSYLRLTLDTPEDLRLTRLVYDALYPGNPDFLLADILQYFVEHPDHKEINSKVVPRSGYWTQTEKEKLAKRLK